MLSLLSPVEYHLLNLLVATDNWFTSMKLALKLLELGIYLFGTCKVNKMGIPKDKVFTRTGANAQSQRNFDARDRLLYVFPLTSFSL